MLKLLIRGVAIGGFVAWAAGCGSKGERAPSALADATVVKPTEAVVDLAELPQPMLQVIEPQQGASFPIYDRRKPNEGIRCVVRLEVPEGGKTPEHVMAQLFLRGQNSGEVTLTPQSEPKGNVWILEGTIAAPRQKGTYEVRAEAMQTVIVAEDILNTKPAPDAFKITRLHSETTEIKVVEP